MQGTLSNIAGGIMLLLSKPFAVGDYIEAGETGGTVREIGLVYTKLATIDNKLISVPNGDIAAAKVVNYSAEPNPEDRPRIRRCLYFPGARGQGRAAGRRRTF